MLPKNSYHARARRNKTSVRAECLRKTITTPDIPDQEEILLITFREDYDIIALHQKILVYIIYQKSSLSFLEQKMKRIHNQLDESRTRFERVQLQATLNEVEKEFRVLSNENRIDEFQMKAKPFLDKYVTIRKPPRSCIGYLNKSKDQTKTLYNPSKEDLQRIECIVGYLAIAKQYRKLDYHCTGYFKELPWYMCEFCEEDLSICPMDKYGMVTCPRCLESKMMRDNTCVDKNNRELTGQVKNNSDNVLKALHEFQGKIPPKTDYELMARELDEYFQHMGFPASAEIRKMNCLPNGKKPGTSMLFMRKGIVGLVKKQGKNYQKFYSSARFMCVYMWGWVLEDLSSIENDILHDDRLLEEGYSLIPYSVKCRTSSIPTQVRLFFHLKRHNVSCEREDFKLPKEISKYNELLKLSCENTTGLKYINI